MRIKLSNAARIAVELASVNGAAERHAYTHAGELDAVARDAEKQLEALGIPKAARGGASVWAQSGSVLPNAYKYRATTTTVKLERGSSAWYLVDARRSELQPRQRPSYGLHLTPDQDAIAVAKLRSTYVAPRAVQMVYL